MSSITPAANVLLPSLTREKILRELAGQGFAAFFFSWGLPKEDFLQDCQRCGHLAIPETPARP